MEFTTKTVLADALAIAANMTSPALFLSNIQGLLDTTCASHKLVSWNCLFVSCYDKLLADWTLQISDP